MRTPHQQAAHNAVNALIFLIPLLSMVMGKTTLAGLLLLALVGLAYRFAGWSPDTKTPLLVKALLVYAGVLTAVNFYHGVSWGAYHIPLAIVLATPFVWLIQSDGIEPEFAYWGAMGGALVGVVAAVETGGLDGVRSGGLFNPIIFGGFGLILATVSLGAFWFKPRVISAPVWSLLVVLCALAGMASSLLSGSKSGWIGMPILLLLLWPIVRSLFRGRPKTSWAVAAVVAFVTAQVLWHGPIVGRVIDAFDGALAYFNGGGQVTEGSVGPRLELWRYGLSSITEHPLMGLGRDGLVVDLHQKALAGEYAPLLAKLQTMHNEFLDAWVTYGLFGFLATVGVYVSLFWQAHVARRLGQHGIATVAVGLGVVMLGLGVGEIALPLKDLRNLFLFFVLLIAGQALRKRDAM